jgi:hypothetical protein
MTPEVYEMAMDLSTRVGKLLGTIGAWVKYDNSDMNNFIFRQLARTYIECSTDQFDIDAVKAQAKKRGVDLT